MSKNESAPFTFVQMNMWDGRLFYPIINFLNRVKADILSAQEVLSGPKEISPSYLTAEAILEKGYFDHVTKGFPLLEEEITIKGTVYSEHCSTFAKNPTALRDTKRIRLADEHTGSKTDRPNSDYFGLLHTTLQLQDGHILHVLNHHGVLVYEGRKGHEPGDHNFKRIAEYAKTLSGAVILSGDFNMHADSRSLKALKDVGLKNLNDAYGITKGRNEFSWQPDEAVSHVFVNDNVIVDSYQVAQDNASDHLPLVMQCRVKA
jgi:endonuclease/exonuclease/phosphatase family metal-dependent hydrolase